MTSRPTRTERAATPARRMPFVTLLALLVLGGMGLLLLLNTASAANELERHGYAQQDEAVAAQVEQLQNQVAASGAPGNLARAAQQLGMVPAANPAFLVVGPDGAVTVRGSAAPASAAPIQLPLAPAHHRTTSTPKKTTKQATKKTTSKRGTKPTSKAPTKQTKKTTTKTTTKTAHTTPTKPGRKH